LRTLDQHLREHLAAMDHLRQCIHLRSYAQKDYRYEYKREAYELFGAMLERVKFDTASVLSRIEVRSEADLQREEEERQRRLLAALQAQHAEAQSPLSAAVTAEAAAAAGAAAAGASLGAASGAMLGLGGLTDESALAGTDAPFVRGDRKVGRNEPCPCGSGKKYKQCHGQLE
ncbi:MAG: SEC-C metal-binding domain-containing protein, partial [Gammaproteobacteria bacterium]